MAVLPVTGRGDWPAGARDGDDRALRVSWQHDCRQGAALGFPEPGWDIPTSSPPEDA